MFAEHKVPMNTVDHSVVAVKLGLPDSDSVEGVNLHRTNCPSIVKNVIARAGKTN